MTARLVRTELADNGRRRILIHDRDGLGYSYSIEVLWEYFEEAIGGIHREWHEVNSLSGIYDTPELTVGEAKRDSAWLTVS